LAEQLAAGNGRQNDVQAHACAIEKGTAATQRPDEEAERHPSADKD
jgi:hypothetical protein